MPTRLLAQDKPAKTEPQGLKLSRPEIAKTLEVQVDSFAMRRDSLMRISDSLHVDSMRRNSEFKAPVAFSASDSISLFVPDKKMDMYGKGTLKYEKTEVQAERIKVDYNTSILEADGIPDTSDHEGLRLLGAPVFKDGETKYETERMRYNFKTKKGKITYTRSKQGEQVMLVNQTRRNPDESFYGKDGKFTTCTHDPPHFYITAKKMKVIPRNKIITGPLYMVIEDSPTPLFLPFGFFPSRPGRSSGVIFPIFQEDFNRGFSLRNGGYYFAPTENVDVLVRGDVYVRGSYRLEILARYDKKYRVQGQLQYQQAWNRVGLPGDVGTQSQPISYNITWNHNQTINPTTKLTAQANIQFSDFNRLNSFQAQQFLATQFRSAISLQKQFLPRRDWTMTLNIDHSQNVTTRIMNMSLPNINLSRSRIFPFRRAVAVGKDRWYEKIGVSYQSNLRNQVQISERNFFKQPMLDSLRFGVAHNASISTQFNVLKYFSLSPSVNYNEYWYLRTIDPTFTRFSYNGTSLAPTVTGRGDIQNAISGAGFETFVYARPVNGFSRAFDFNFNASLGTRIYGVVQTASPRRRAFRHTITPTLSYTIRPDFSDPQWGFYKQVPVDSTGRNIARISRFSDLAFLGGIVGGPGAGRAQTLTLQINNLLEMKWLQKQDSAAIAKREKPKFKYMNLLDNLSTNVSYNLVADSFHLSQIPIQIRTQLFEGRLNLQTNLNYDPYVVVVDPQGLANPRRIDRYTFSNYSLGRLNGANIVVSWALRSPKAKTAPTPAPSVAANPDNTAQLSELQRYRDLYYDFNIPWSLTINYNWTYTSAINGNIQADARPFIPSLTQALNLNFEFQLTSNWRISGGTGWDFLNNRVTFTQFSILRTIHCWDLSFNAIPFGLRQSYSLQINVKSSVLQDIKFQRRRDWQDRFTQGF